MDPDEIMQALASSKPHVYIRTLNKLHTFSKYHIKLHICLKHPHYLNNPITLHTSQAATTSRAPTQTTDFSEAEESTDSHESDDRLSWQEVSGRGKKRASPQTTGVSIFKKKTPQGTNNSSSQIITTNKFEPLRHTEKERNSGYE
jgi:hypothetical protein